MDKISSSHELYNKRGYSHSSMFTVVPIVYITTSLHSFKFHRVTFPWLLTCGECSYSNLTQHSNLHM